MSTTLPHNLLTRPFDAPFLNSVSEKKRLSADAVVLKIEQRLQGLTTPSRPRH